MRPKRGLRENVSKSSLSDRAPNTRLQQTPLRAPLSRKPLGGTWRFSKEV